MLRTFIQDRGTGKTTKAIGILESNNNAIIVTFSKEIKHVSSDTVGNQLSNRVFTFSDIINDKVDLQEYDLAIVDEGYIGKPDVLAHVYYKLGRAKINTIVYGTIR